MKKIKVILAVLFIGCAFAFATDTETTNNKGLSIGVDIGIMNQGILVRYDTGRWFDIEGSFRLPVTFYAWEGIDALVNRSEFDPYTILSPELSVTGYVTPLQIGCFSLGLGLNGTAYVNMKGPWVEKPGTTDEVKHGNGSYLGVVLKAAAKFQFDFDDWGFNIAGFYPIVGAGKDIGDVHLGTALTSIFSMIYNSVRIDFSFKL